MQKRPTSNSAEEELATLKAGLAVIRQIVNETPRQSPIALRQSLNEALDLLGAPRVADRG